MPDKDQLTLRIGGFCIAVRLTQSTLPYEKTIFVQNLLGHYSGFIDRSPNVGKPDHVLEVYDEKHFSVLKKDTMHFASFYVNKGAKTRTFYHISLSQFTLIIAMILQNLLRNKGFILHASGVVIDRKAYIFTGPSEAGKSTISSILSEKYRQIGDDSVIIRKEGSKYIVYMTPLIEKNTHLFNRGKEGFEIAAIFFLKKTGGNPKHTGNADPSEVVANMSAQLWVERDYRKQIELLIKMVSSGIPIWNLSFPKNRKILHYMESLSRT